LEFTLIVQNWRLHVLRGIGDSHYRLDNCSSKFN